MRVGHEGIIILLLSTSLLELCRGGNVEGRCREQCVTLSGGEATEEEAATSSNHCDGTCKLHLCQDGCSFWREALHESCARLCAEAHGSKSFEVSFCIVGCNLSVDIYAQDVTSALQNISYPVLELGKESNESVILYWRRPRVANVTYSLQKQVVGVSPEWRPHLDLHWLREDNEIDVQGLRPYVIYKFRVLIHITAHHELLSPESLEIPTKPYGVPSDPPIFVNITLRSNAIILRWKAPVYVNSRLVGYFIEWTDAVSAVATGSDWRRDHVGPNKPYIDLRDLVPETQYKIRVSAINKFGVGPPLQQTVTTPPLETATPGDDSSPYLVLGADSQILRLNLGELEVVEFFPEPVVLYDTRNASVTISDVGIHYAQRWVFWCDSAGLVQRLSMDRPERPKVVYRSSAHPSTLSVDWLHDKLYIGEEEKIQSCELDGTQCRMAVRGLHGRPAHIVADPCSGFLLWSELGHGLYRVDLDDLGSPSLDLDQHLFIPFATLTTFTVSCLDYKVYYPNETQNTIIAVHLGGGSDVDVRQNVQQAVFRGMVSLLHWVGDATFYWSRDGHVWMEHRDAEVDMYYHNEVYLGDVHRNNYVGLTMWHPRAQPTPQPQTAPRDVQALFSTDSAVLKWKVPKHDYGEGAWKNWRYEVNMKQGSHSRPFTNLTGTQLVLATLSPETPYSFRVRAYSEGGYGPWSNDLEDWTYKYKEGTKKPRLTYAMEGIISQVHLDGRDNKVLFSHRETLHQVRDLISFDNTYMWSTASRGIYIKERGRAIRQLSATTRGAGALAYDWLGKTLYYTNGIKIERIGVSRTAKTTAKIIHHGSSDIQDIAVDAEQGYIYWTSTCEVEAARLDGTRGRVTIQQRGGSCNMIQGKLFLGLALDLDSECMYWLYNDGDRMTLYKSGLLGRENAGNLQKTGEIASSAFSPSLEYFGGKLFWQGGISNITVTDTRGQHGAVMQLQTGTTKRLAFCVDYSDRFRYPAGLSSEEDVTPTPVNASTIRITGTWSSFNISWGPAAVNHGDVYYAVVVNYDGLSKPITNETSATSMTMRGIDPYTSLNISIESCTSWGCAEAGVKVLRSPMGTPSIPTNPRIFVSHQRRKALSSSITIQIEFRWSPPSRPNGEIDLYKVYVSNKPEGARSWLVVTHKAHKMSYKKFTNPDETFYFKVEVCITSGSCSSTTAVIEENTTAKKPVPRLLTAANHSLQFFLPDEKNATTLAISDIVSLTYIAYDSSFYWLDDGGRVMKLVGSSKEALEVVSTNGTGDSLTVDWISRVLYWVQEFPEQPDAIVKYDLSKGEQKYSVLIRRTSMGRVVVNPYDQSLYWTERDKLGQGHLMRGRMDGREVLSILEKSNETDEKSQRRRRRRQQSCNCPDLSVSEVLVLDQTRPESPEIFLVDNATGSIWATDLEGCRCRRVVDAATQGAVGLPPDSLTVDMNHLYWTNKKQGTLQSVDKFSGFNLLTESTGGVTNVVAFGRYLQPLPAPECLLVDNFTAEPHLADATNVSLTLNLSLWQPNLQPACQGQSAPAVLYRVHYRMLLDPSDEHRCDEYPVRCLEEDSYDPIVTLTGLEPFSPYYVQVSSSNIFMDSEGQENHLGPFKTFWTKEGIPSPPREFTAQPITPEKVNVTWRSPADPKGHNLSYAIAWRTVDPDNMKLSSGKVNVPHSSTVKQYHSYTVDDLKAGRKYYFKVLAYNQEKTGTSSSAEVPTMTHQNPSSIRLVQAKQTSLIIAWTSPSDHSAVRHTYQYIKLPEPPEGKRWLHHSQPQHTDNATSYNETFSNLQANTEYAFRLMIAYKSSVYATYYWPVDTRFHFSTGADVPGQPLPPVLKQTKSGVDTVTWQPPPMDGGADIEMYQLSIRSMTQGNVTVEVIGYNLTELHWVVSGLESGEQYVFHVSAMNNMGWGAFSNASSIFVPTPGEKKSLNKFSVILISTLTVLFCIIILALILLFFFYYRNKDHKPVPFNLVNGRTDTELATLRDAPHITLDTPNALYPLNDWSSSYAIGGIIPTDEDVAALPHYRRDQLTLTQFLGSGAFGEVFEGLARNIISEDSGDTKVAVKTLRKGATDQEKEEFLKEALLMSNFKHEHILRLLGVCLDNDPQFIILELMEGGDLLSYLRSSRPTPTVGPKLGLPDMVSICCDVAKGCKYLEDMHFVHRDLAARNCLVSSKDPRLRMVKIGDFGLARDIYKNDYYRKEGEGLLPVRWMSPESLIDGVFAMQSDVWAFGVMMWEVLTLGQQPYPARNNIEVLHFVRGGGRLDRPDNCPDDLYHLMRECWAFTPQERPSFHYIHEQLESFKRRSSDPNSDFSGGHVNISYHGDTVDYITHDDLAQPINYLTHSGLAKAEINALNKHDLAREATSLEKKSTNSKLNYLSHEDMAKSELNYLSHEDMAKSELNCMSHEDMPKPELNYLSHEDMAKSELNYVSHEDMPKPELNYLSHEDMAKSELNYMSHEDMPKPELNYLSHEDMAKSELNYMSHDMPKPELNYLSHEDMAKSDLNYLSHDDMAKPELNYPSHGDMAKSELNYLSHDMAKPELNYMSHEDMATPELNYISHKDLAKPELNYLTREDLAKPDLNNHWRLGQGTSQKDSEDFGDYITLREQSLDNCLNSVGIDLSQYTCDDLSSPDPLSHDRDLTQASIGDVTTSHDLTQITCDDMYSQDWTPNSNEGDSHLAPSQNADLTQHTCDVSSQDMTRGSDDVMGDVLTQHTCDISSQDMTQGSDDVMGNVLTQHTCDISSQDMTRGSDDVMGDVLTQYTCEGLTTADLTQHSYDDTTSGSWINDDITEGDIMNQQVTNGQFVDITNQTDLSGGKTTDSDYEADIINQCLVETQCNDITNHDGICSQCIVDITNQVVPRDESDGDIINPATPSGDITEGAVTPSDDVGVVPTLSPSGAPLPPRVPIIGKYNTVNAALGLDEGDSSIPVEQPPKIPSQSPLNSTKRPVCVKRGRPYDSKHGGRHLGADEDSQGYLEPLVRPTTDHHKYLELVDSPDDARPKRPPPRSIEPAREMARVPHGPKKKLNYAELEGPHVSDAIDTDNPHAMEGAGYYAPPGSGVKTHSGTDRGPRKGSSGGRKVDYAELASSEDAGEAAPPVDRSNSRNNHPRTDDSKMDSVVPSVSNPSSPSSPVPGYTDSNDLGKPKSRSGYMVPESPARVVPDHRVGNQQYDRPRPYQLSPSNGSPFTDSSRGSSPFMYADQQPRGSTPYVSDSLLVAEAKPGQGNPLNGVPLNRLTADSTC